MVVDQTSDDGHYAAPRADVEFCGACAKGVFRYQGAILDHHFQSTPWIGGPHAAVLGTKRASACTGRNFSGIRLPAKGEGDVPAVTPTVDQHVISVVAAPNVRVKAAARQGRRLSTSCWATRYRHAKISPNASPMASPMGVSSRTEFGMPDVKRRRPGPKAKAPRQPSNAPPHAPNTEKLTTDNGLNLETT